MRPLTLAAAIAAVVPSLAAAPVPKGAERPPVYYPNRVGHRSLFLLTASAAEPDETGALRDKVLKADKPNEKAAAYKALFEKVGRAKLADLMKDEDTSIALQAAWETYKAPAKRPVPLDIRTDDIYDPSGLKAFLGYLEVRTKAPVPSWWAARVVRADLFPGQHHAFIADDWLTAPGRVREVPPGAELKRRGESLVYAAGGRQVEFEDSAFGGPPFGPTGYAGVLGERGPAVARFTDTGFAYKLAGFEGRGGKPAWVADVWAAGRWGATTGVHHHDGEVREKGGTVFVFGAESHGMYLEAFDLATGECKYRFCSVYWFNFSEKWGLK